MNTLIRPHFLLAACLLASCVGSDHGRTSDSKTAPPRVRIDQVAVLLIDAQPAFFKIMHGPREPVEARLRQLLLVADVHQIPLLATFEHDPKWNGWLPESLEKVFPAHGARMVKKSFDCCAEPEVRSALAELARTRSQVVVAGAETDVCVLQSCLGLLEMGFEVFLLEDCLFTHEPNIQPSLRRLQAAGVVPTTYKTVFFELTRGVGPRRDDDATRERRARVGDSLISPYDLPPWRR
jgi:nicotinamidase-related amidase